MRRHLWATLLMWLAATFSTDPAVADAAPAATIGSGCDP